MRTQCALYDYNNWSPRPRLWTSK